MAKRSNPRGQSEWASNVTFIEPEPTNEVYIFVTLAKDVILKIAGPSGREYTFNGAGSIVAVLENDISIFEAKNNTNHESCCGSVNSPYFVINR